MRYNRCGETFLDAQFPQLVESLVRVPSVNGESERDFGEFFRSYLDARLPKSLVRIEVSDANQRPSFAVLKQGLSRDWLILLGHYDTVGVSSYGTLASLAFEPEALRQAIAKDPRLGEEERKDLCDDRWLWGRGALDMKAGIAVIVEVLRELQDQSLPSLALLIVPDEEGDSSGVKTSLPVLLKELKKRDARVGGVIKADFTENEAAIYAGTTGKMLLNAYVRGVSGHAGKPQAAISSASVLADLEITLRSYPHLSPPPVCLQTRTLCDHYSTQIPDEGWMYVNLLFREEEPEQVLEDLTETAKEEVGKKYGLPVTLLSFESSETPKKDPRLDALAAVRKSAVVPGIYFFLSPPFYAPVGADFSRESRLGKAVRRSIQNWNMSGLGPPTTLKRYYPFISDLSFFSSDMRLATAVQRRCPVSLDFLPLLSAKEKTPVFDIGPRGKGAHDWTERVDVRDAELRVKTIIEKTIMFYYEE